MLLHQRSTIRIINGVGEKNVATFSFVQFNLICIYFGMCLIVFKNVATKELGFYLFFCANENSMELNAYGSAQCFFSSASLILYEILIIFSDTYSDFFYVDYYIVRIVCHIHFISITFVSFILCALFQHFHQN